MKAHLFNLRNQEDLDFYYPILRGWWESWNQPAIDTAFLPEIGVMISNDEKYICAAFLYRTDSKLCLFDWCISTKEHRELREGCIKMLANTLENIARELGFQACSVKVSNPYLATKLEKMGYNENGLAKENMINFIKRI